MIHLLWHLQKFHPIQGRSYIQNKHLRGFQAMLRSMNRKAPLSYRILHEDSLQLRRLWSRLLVKELGSLVWKSTHNKAEIKRCFWDKFAKIVDKLAHRKCNKKFLYEDLDRRRWRWRWSDDDHIEYRNEGDQIAKMHHLPMLFCWKIWLCHRA